jgi:ABC-type antimicrobial peptide transport system permease subunit
VISSFVRVTTADLGFDRSNVLFVSGNTGVDAADTFAAIARLLTLPGVAGVGAVALGSPPLASAGFRSGGATATSIAAAGRPQASAPLVAEIRGVSSGYFAAAGIPVVKGRSFDDNAAMRDTAIAIDDRTASELFGQDEAVGAEVLVSGRERRTVVAVVRHVQQRGPEQTSSPQIYVPASIDKGGFNFLFRTSGPAETMVPAIRAAFPAAATSGAAALQVRPLEAAFRNITADRRFSAGLMSIFGALAVVIGAAGIYGVIASVVAQQTREMAVRVALGATASRITVSVIAGAGRSLIAGLAIGLTVAWWASQAIAPILYDVRPTDTGVYATVAGVLIGVGLVAAWIPARRASRVDPLLALRSQ